ncbi:MAG: SPASM domain-containing protein [Elusimicrobia bacterium]|nr:SPASM domain-containing protein [Elusimicrobiota bacterium]
MELIDLSRYATIRSPAIIPPFSSLRNSDSISFTPNLELVETPENLHRVDQLIKAGWRVARVHRIPPDTPFPFRKTFPRRILFEMTSNCNYRCRMCPQNNLTRPRIHMEGDLYRRGLDEIDVHGVEGLWLYHLGESILHPEFREILQYVSSKKHLGTVWMSTNGRYFDEQMARFVMESSVDYVNFSAHGVTQSAYESVIPGGAFEIVQRNLEAFYRLKGSPRIKRKPFIHTQMIEQESTQGEVDSFIAQHIDRADLVSINMLEYVNLPKNQFGIQQRDRPPLRSCLRVERNDCFICSNGSVTLCDAAYNGEIFLGDIHTQTIEEIWNGEKRKEILELSRSGRMGEIEFCRHCTDYDI